VHTVEPIEQQIDVKCLVSDDLLLFQRKQFGVVSTELKQNFFLLLLALDSLNRVDQDVSLFNVLAHQLELGSVRHVADPALDISENRLKKLVFSLDGVGVVEDVLHGLIVTLLGVHS